MMEERLLLPVSPSCDTTGLDSAKRARTRETRVNSRSVFNTLNIFTKAM